MSSRCLHKQKKEREEEKKKSMGVVWSERKVVRQLVQLERIKVTMQPLDGRVITICSFFFFFS
jgi:hypothetical protein